MTREQFMLDLKRYLKGIPSHELEELRVYYHEMFEEAGIDRYDEVPESFGDPHVIALEVMAQIHSDGGTEVRVREQKEPIYRRRGVIFLLGLLALPIGLPLILTVFGVLLGVGISAVAILFALAITVWAPFYILFTIGGLGWASIVFLLGIIFTGLGMLILLVRAYIAMVDMAGKWISRRALERKERKARKEASHEEEY